MAAPIYWTADMVRDLPDDGNRYELVRGELLVSPSPKPRHQIVVGRLHLAIGAYLLGSGLGEVLMAPADVSWGDDDVLLQPDVFVVLREELRSERWTDLRRLQLVAEVLSPSTARNDRFVKRAEYQRRGVGLLWLVDAAEGYVEVWTPEAHCPRVERERIAWHAEGAEAPLEISLPELFRPV